VVKTSKPEKIYTTHGFQKEFARYLNFIGFDAEPIDKQKKSKIKINKNNKTLDGFF
jgi:hypothetical protein